MNSPLYTQISTFWWIWHFALKFQHFVWFPMFHSNFNILINSPVTLWSIHVLKFWHFDSPFSLKFQHYDRVLTTLDVQKMKFGEIKKLWAMLKIWLENEIFDHLDLGRIKFGRIHKFQSRLKFGSKFTFFSTLDLGRLNKSHIEYLAQNWHFWPLRTCKKDEIWQNSEIFSRVEKFGSKLTFLNTQNMQRMKCSKIQKFSVTVKIRLKIESLTPWDLQKINLAKSRNF